MSSKSISKKKTSKKVVKKPTSKKAPSKKAPGKKAPSKKAPGKSGPKKNPPAKKAPGKKKISKTTIIQKSKNNLSTDFTQLVKIKYPIIGGAMYPCSNPELVAAVSEAGGIGIVQPVSLTFVHGYHFREGLRYIKSITKNPIGLNLLIEKSSKKYLEKNKEWLEIAIEEGVRFFITALGNPKWVVDRLKKVKGAVVFHDVTSKDWAEKAVSAGVDGLICVNNRAGGHAGNLSPQQLYDDLKTFGLPLICAGGIGGHGRLQEALKIGYQGVQLGTRFIASKECTAHEDYKKAILKADASDIIMSKKLTGVPVSVINTDYIKKIGSKPNKIIETLLSHPKTKHLVRMFYSVKSLWELKQSLKKGNNYKEYWQAGKSVEDIQKILTVKEIMDQLVK